MGKGDVSSVIDAIIAKRDAEIERLRAQVARYKAAWEAERNVSADATAVRENALRQVAELEAWKAAVPVDAIAFLVGATDASLGETPQAARVVKWWANSTPS